jgi:hypothetical protein
MFSALDRYGLPVKYAIIGFVAGVIWLLVRGVFGFESDSGPVMMLAAFTIGGLAGGWLRKRAGKSS